MCPRWLPLVRPPPVRALPARGERPAVGGGGRPAARVGAHLFSFATLASVVMMALCAAVLLWESPAALRL